MQNFLPKLIAIICSITILFASCDSHRVYVTPMPPTPEYYGASYQPTANIDIYINKNDVSKPYVNMGKASSYLRNRFTLAAYQTQIENLAKAKGADAIILEKTTDTISKNVVNNIRVTIDTSRKNLTNNNTHTSSENYVRENYLNAEFIKYK
jgi:hypothetical protein